MIALKKKQSMLNAFTVCTVNSGFHYTNQVQNMYAILCQYTELQFSSEHTPTVNWAAINKSHKASEKMEAITKFHKAKTRKRVFMEDTYQPLIGTARHIFRVPQEFKKET